MRLWKLSLVLGCWLLSSGCMISFSRHTLSKSTGLPVIQDPSKRPRALIDVYFNQKVKLSKEREDLFQGYMTRTVQKSGVNFDDLFKEYGFSPAKIESPDVQVHLKFEMGGLSNGAIVATFFSGLTFSIIPAFNDQTLTLTGTVTDRNGNTLQKLVLSEQVRVWYELLFLFAPNKGAGEDTAIKELSAEFFRQIDWGNFLK